MLFGSKLTYKLPSVSVDLLDVDLFATEAGNDLFQAPGHEDKV